MGVRVVFPDMGKDPSIQLIEKTITENGTYDALTDGANGYSKVNVNVEGGGGSSDFSTAEVTVLVTGSTDNAINFEDLIVIEEVGNQRHLQYIANFGVGDEESPQQFEVLLIDGAYAVVFNKTGTITVSGEAELLEADLLLIRGDCTITIS